MKNVSVSILENEIVLETSNSESNNTINVRKTLQTDKNVTIKGEWYNRPDDLIKILEYISKYKLRVRFITDRTLEHFRLSLGKHAFETTNGYELNNVEDYDMPMLSLIGAVLLDYHLSHTEYYIESVEKDGNHISVFKMTKDK